MTAVPTGVPVAAGAVEVALDWFGVWFALVEAEIGTVSDDPSSLSSAHPEISAVIATALTARIDSRLIHMW
ncbi:hypothetical protein VZC37_07825 [Gordonia sp. LSe1-13]|uniref:Uncharacterized protein n=1 Tax=Gordonia sesuvii TaxID=3116777 RepID=A0ABU7MBM3_9ACTN|nr:hypothetical protein [Gordonia sp. LSe1-13]